MDQLQFVLGMLGCRMDDKFTAVLEKQLEFVKAQTYDIAYRLHRGDRLYADD